MKQGLLVEIEEGLTWSTWRATFQAAEELGFESIWISDHLCSAWSSKNAVLEAWTALAVAAAETRRIQLGTLVSPVTFREPAIVARMAEALHALSGGRFTLGLGLGWNRGEHDTFGIAFPPVAARARRLEATVQCLRDVPVLIGGAGERWTLPLVARHADEWNVTTSSAELVAERAAVLARLCQELGRDARAIKRSVAVGYLIGRDEAELCERSRRMQAWVAPLAVVDPAQVTAEAKRIGWLVGTPEDIKVQMRSLAAVGVERVIFGHYDLDDLSALELLTTLR